jgi:hypothetical protein
MIIRFYGIIIRFYEIFIRYYEILFRIIIRNVYLFLRNLINGHCELDLLIAQSKVAIYKSGSTLQPNITIISGMVLKFLYFSEQGF